MNVGLGSTPEIHPLHFHGHKFWVVAMADLPWPVDQRERPPYNLDDPVLVDGRKAEFRVFVLLDWAGGGGGAAPRAFVYRPWFLVKVAKAPHDGIAR